MSVFKLLIQDPQLAERMSEGGRPLQDLCLKEAEEFSESLRDDPNFRDGLAKWEKQIIATFLYQTYRRTQDGQTTGVDDVLQPNEAKNG